MKTELVYTRGLARAIVVIAMLVIALAACGMAPPPAGYLPAPAQLSRDMRATPAAIVQSATAVFAAEGIPIAVRDTGGGILQGGSLTVEGLWGRAMVKDRVYCGERMDSGVEYTLSNPVTLTVGIIATPQAEGSSVRFVFSGNVATRASALRNDPGPTYACQPTAALVNLILDAVQKGAESTTP